jgi:integrase
MYMLNQEQYTLEALSKILGHKKIATTETYYTQRTIELVHKAVLDHEVRVRS